MSNRKGKGKQVQGSVHPVAAKRGRRLGTKLRGAKRGVQRGATAVHGALAMAAGSVAAFATGFWKAF